MKNPWLGLWLSAANRAAGTARGLWTAEMRRAQAAAVREAGRAATGTRRKQPRRRKP